VKIAVARMEDVGNAETRCSGHALDFSQNDRQFDAWNNAILDYIVRRETSRCGKGGFATLPDQKPFLFALGESIFPCAVCPADLTNLQHMNVDLADRAIQFDEKEGFAGGIIRMDGGFRGLYRQSIHNLHRCGENRRGNNIGDSLAGGRDGVVSGKENLNRLGSFDNTKSDGRNDAECSFRAHEDAGQVIAGRIHRRGAQMDELSAGKYDVQSKNVSGSKAVFEAVRSPSIFGYVTTDGADALGGWVGSIEVA
jgi:hypothetical protein